MKYLVVTLLAAVASFSSVFCAEASALKPGDAVPPMTSTDETGKQIELASFKGKEGLVIFFFPKAFTGG